jgi:2-keto-4-pentenoate hydratase/2-oxohepta-3-ene-1,7-dioic acid hydratase in catechol pathway
MKLISYRHEGTERYGVTDGDGIIDMSARLGDRFPTLKDAIAGLGLNEIAAAAEGASADVAVAEIEFMFPITTPEKFFCVGRNYKEYHEVLADGGPKLPSIFTRHAASFAAHGEAILKPAVSDQLDYEGELGVIIGKSGRHIPRERALDYIAGYTIINEGTVRDWLRRGTQNFPGKNFYRSGSIGPWMVTADEIADLSKVPIVTRVDGEVRQDGMTDMMIFDIPFVISHISTFTWLEPGDMIATGSPGGSAIESDPPAWLRPGQEIEIEIAPIGVLRNRIEAEAS